MSDDTKHDPARPDRIPVEELRDWETVQQNDQDYTQRLRIVGGYLYRSMMNGEGATVSIAMVYVPSTNPTQVG